MNNNKDLTINEIFSLAVKNHQEGKTDIALKLYNQVLKIQPNHSQSLNNLGVIFQNQMNHEKAKDCVEKAIAIKPDYADAHNNLGIIFEKLGENQKAKECYEKAIEIKPDYANAHNNLGIIFKELKDYQKAKECYEKAIELNPNYANAYNNLSVIFIKLKDFQKAKECFEKVIAINPNYTPAYNNLGNIFKELGEYEKAKSCYEKVIEIDPNYSQAHNNLGVIFKDLGEYEKAKSCSEKAIEIDPNFYEAHNNLGVIFKDLGEYEKAKSCYEKAIAINPDYEDAHNNLHRISKQKKLLSKIKQTKNLDNKNKISFFKKDTAKSLELNLNLTSNLFISSRKVEVELTNQLYKINTKKLDDVDPGYLRYGNGRSSNYKLFENDFSIIKIVKKDLINIMKEAVKSDIFIMESFFNIFQAGSGIIFHNHIESFDYNFGLSNQKFSLTYYLDIGDQNCKEPGILKLQSPDKEILPSEGMIVIFPASRSHSATYSGKKDRVMIGVNFYSLTPE
jgi:tetratricopeptide (TPR) repeat protein